jgi:hypothetical protein
VIALVAGVIALGGWSGAGAGSTSVTGKDVSVVPGGAVAFTVSGHSEQVIGAFRIDLTFDDDLVQPHSCQASNALCNLDVEPGRVRLNSVSLLGFTGDITFATIVFEAVGPQGSVAPVDIDVSALADTDGIDLLGEAVVVDGSITIAGPATPPPGDANCDSVVDAADSLAIIGGLAGIPDGDCAAQADVNCDGRVDAEDALVILRLIGGLPLDLPPGCDVFP